MCSLQGTVTEQRSPQSAQRRWHDIILLLDLYSYLGFVGLSPQQLLEKGHPAH